jgi:hypothetical protein
VKNYLFTIGGFHVFCLPQSYKSTDAVWISL